MKQATSNEREAIRFEVVSQDDRFAFLTKHLGDFGVYAEHLAHQSLRDMASAYKGGYWEYYRLSNGGFFIAPVAPESGPDKLRLVIPSVRFDKDVSYQAAGIIATGFGINLTIESSANTDSRDNKDYPKLRDQICKMFDYFPYHAEQRKLYAAFR